MSTLTRPETQREAVAFGTRRNRYAGAGLCDVCAAQAAYGHAHGSRAVQAPCTRCAVVVSTFPSPKRNGWRFLALGSDDLLCASVATTSDAGTVQDSGTPSAMLPGHLETLSGSLVGGQ